MTKVQLKKKKLKQIGVQVLHSPKTQHYKIMVLTSLSKMLSRVVYFMYTC